jgi:hypothetical protein
MLHPTTQNFACYPSQDFSAVSLVITVASFTEHGSDAAVDLNENLPVWDASQS